MVVTNNGRPVAILSSVDESSLEETLCAFRQVRAVSAVASLQRRSVEKGTDKLALSDIKREIRSNAAARPSPRSPCPRLCPTATTIRSSRPHSPETRGVS